MSNTPCPRCGDAVPRQLQVHPNSKCAICSIREVKMHYEEQIGLLNMKIEELSAENLMLKDKWVPYTPEILPDSNFSDVNHYYKVEGERVITTCIAKVNYEITKR